MSDTTKEPQGERLSLTFDGGAAPTNRTRSADTRSAAAPPPQTSPGYYGAVGYGTSYGQSGDAIHLSDYLRILHKRRWTAVSAFLLVFGSVTIYTLLATPQYTARVQILIENENPNVVAFEEVYDQNQQMADYYQTQYRILQSRLLARRTLEAEKLWTNELFVLPPQSFWAAASNFVTRPFRDEAEQPAPDESQSQSRSIDAFLARLTVTPVRNSRLVDVGFRTPNAALSSQVANALSRQYIDQNLEFKYLANKEANEFLTQRMSEQRKSLEQSEQALQKYRERTGAVAFEDRQNIVVQRLADLNAAVTRARTERIEKESVYNQIRTIQNDKAAIDTHPAILTNAFIQQLNAELNNLQRQRAQLAEKLGARHPEMVKSQSAIESTEARIAAEVQKVVLALRSDYQAALSNERALQTSLDQQRTEAQELNRNSIQYGSLQRDSASNQTMFEGLLQRSKETGISSELRTSNIRVVDKAETPRRPSSPNVASNLIFALFGGSLLGIGLAFFFEYLDNRIKQPDEIKTDLGMPFLGMVGLFKPKEVTGPPVIGNGMPQAFSEAFRTIRTNLLFSTTETGSKSVVVTSTGPGEGKSVISANVALALAQAGQRVLLIDADMRRPKVHELFGAACEPGLSNVLVGDSKASETVKKTLTPNLWLLPAGKHPPNPAELLGSRRFADFMASLAEHFDWVIVDSPPVMAVTDASVIAHSAHGVIFVVGAEMTNKGAARAALDQLDSVGAKYIGGILNRVDVRGNAYYYSRHYRKEYQSYYTKA